MRNNYLLVLLLVFSSCTKNSLNAEQRPSNNVNLIVNSITNEDRPSGKYIPYFKNKIYKNDQNYFLGQGTGNGGDIVICKSSNDKIITSELLDIYELKEYYFLNIPEFKNQPFEFILNHYLTEVLHPKWKYYQYYKERIDLFLDRVKFVNYELEDVADSYHIILPNNCEIKQIAINKMNGEIVINEKLWNKLDSFNKVALVFHELFYEDAILSGQTDSISTRKTNAHFLTERIDFVDVHFNGSNNLYSNYDYFEKMLTNELIYKSSIKNKNLVLRHTPFTYVQENIFTDAFKETEPSEIIETIEHVYINEVLKGFKDNSIQYIFKSLTEELLLIKNLDLYKDLPKRLFKLDKLNFGIAKLTSHPNGPSVENVLKHYEYRLPIYKIFQYPKKYLDNKDMFKVLNIFQSHFHKRKPQGGKWLPNIGQYKSAFDCREYCHWYSEDFWKYIYIISKYNIPATQKLLINTLKAEHNVFSIISNPYSPILDWKVYGSFHYLEKLSKEISFSEELLELVFNHFKYSIYFEAKGYIQDIGFYEQAMVLYNQNYRVQELIDILKKILNSQETIKIEGPLLRHSKFDRHIGILQIIRDFNDKIIYNNLEEEVFDYFKRVTYLEQDHFYFLNHIYKDHKLDSNIKKRIFRDVLLETYPNYRAEGEEFNSIKNHVSAKDSFHQGYLYSNWHDAFKGFLDIIVNKKNYDYLSQRFLSILIRVNHKDISFDDAIKTLRKAPFFGPELLDSIYQELQIHDNSSDRFLKLLKSLHGRKLNNKVIDFLKETSQTFPNHESGIIALEILSDLD
jgi:acetone carboxylase gamma subunit